MATSVLERLIVKIEARDAQFSKTLLRAQKTAIKFGNKMEKMGKALTRNVTLPLALMGAAAVFQFARFDQAMTNSTAIIIGLSSELREEMEETAAALSTVGVQSATDLAEAYFFLASAGLSAEESIAALPIVQQFATAGAFKMALATDLLTDAQSALGLNIGNTAQKMTNLIRVSDVLVKANTLANATVEQFSTALTSKAGAALKSFNKDVEEGVAVLAAMADQGIKSQLAGASLDRMIRLLSQTALKNADAHEALGFKVFDNEGKMRNLGSIIGNLESVLKGMSDETKVATLDMLGFEARVQQVILPLLGTSAAIKDYERQLRDAAGITKEVSDKQMKSFQNRMMQTWRQILRVAGAIGSMLVPAVEVLNSIMKKGLDLWESTPKAVRIMVVATFALAAIMGPLAITLGLVSKGMALFQLLTLATTAGVWGSVAALTAFKIALVSTGVGAFVVLIGLAVAAIMNFNKATGVSVEKVTQVNKVLSKQEEQQKRLAKVNARDLPEALKLQARLQNDLNHMEMLRELTIKRLTNTMLNGTKAEAEAVRITLAISDTRINSLARQLDVTNELVKARKEEAKIQSDLDPNSLVSRLKNAKKADKQIDDLIGTIHEEVAILILEAEGYKNSSRELEIMKLTEAGVNEEKIKTVRNLMMEADAREALAKKKQDDIDKTKKLSDSVENFTKSLKFQRDTFKMTSREAELFKLKQMGATDAQLAASKAHDEAITKLEKQKEAADKLKKATQELKPRDAAEAGSSEALRRLDAFRRNMAMKGATGKTTASATVSSTSSGITTGPTLAQAGKDNSGAILTSMHSINAHLDGGILVAKKSKLKDSN